MFECSFLASLTHWIDTKLSGWLRLIFTCKGQLKFIFVEQLDTVCGYCGIQGLYFAYSIDLAPLFPHSNPGIGHTDCINRRQRKKGHSCDGDIYNIIITGQNVSIMILVTFRLEYEDDYEYEF